MKEFKGTPGPWSQEEGVISGLGEPYVVAVVTEVNPDKYIEEANANLIAAAPNLLKALLWALPLAKIAMAQHQLERCRNGHTDITGTYKDGVTWAGIYQDEVDSIEQADTAINEALGK